MRKSILIILMLVFSTMSNAQGNSEKTISRNKMKVSWYYKADKIYFEMSAPTDGWVTIGFNTTSGTKGAYLLMGNVINSKPNVTEHYTLNPGNYKAITELGEKNQVSNVWGVESSSGTSIKFSLPVKPVNKYQKDMSEGNKYTMIIAYSQEDDFQHHSIMRTSVNIKL